MFLCSSRTNWKDWKRSHPLFDIWIVKLSERHRRSHTYNRKKENCILCCSWSVFLFIHRRRDLRTCCIDKRSTFSHTLKRMRQTTDLCKSNIYFFAVAFSCASVVVPYGVSIFSKPNASRWENENVNPKFKNRNSH